MSYFVLFRQISMIKDDIQVVFQLSCLMGHPERKHLKLLSQNSLMFMVNIKPGISPYFQSFDKGLATKMITYWFLHTCSMFLNLRNFKMCH